MFMVDKSLSSKNCGPFSKSYIRRAVAIVEFVEGFTKKKKVHSSDEK